VVKERMRLSEGIDEGKRATVCLGLYVGTTIAPAAITDASALEAPPSRLPAS